MGRRRRISVKRSSLAAITSKDDAWRDIELAESCSMAARGARIRWGMFWDQNHVFIMLILRKIHGCGGNVLRGGAEHSTVL